jgi:hypothetical protein
MSFCKCKHGLGAEASASTVIHNVQFAIKDIKDTNLSNINISHLKNSTKTLCDIDI